MSIADLFRVQQAAMASPNPMDPNIGKSTSLPPQLLDLLKQSAATEQAQMRQQAQAQQGNGMPTVAETVREKAATLNQQAQMQQSQQQELMQQLMQAKQAPQAFQAGGIVALPKRYAEGGFIKYAPYGYGNMQSMSEEDRKSVQERMKAGLEADPGGILAAIQSLMAKGKASLFDDPNLAWNMADKQKREADAETRRETRDTYVNKTDNPIQALKEATDVASGRGAARDGGRSGGEQRFDSTSPAGAKSQGVAALKEAVSDGASQTPQQAPADGQTAYGEYVRRMLEEKGPNRDEEIKRLMALRQQYGPAGAEADFIKQQMARRDAEIAKAEGERPGITQIITAMAQAARANDAQRRKGSGAAALLGAAEFVQGSKKEREAKVKELQAAKDTMLQKLAALEDAKKSGDLQAVVAADGEARQAAQKLQEKQATVAGTMASQELQEKGATGRTNAQIAAQASEGDKNRANQVKTAQIAASARAARGFGGADDDMSRRYDRAVDNAQKEFEAIAKTPKGMMLSPQQQAALQNDLMAKHMKLLGLTMPGSLQSTPAPTTGSGLDLKQWGQPTVVK